jgi:hypothetical protein
MFKAISLLVQEEEKKNQWIEDKKSSHLLTSLT